MAAADDGRERRTAVRRVASTAPLLQLTRVVTYMKSRDASQRVYPKIGATSMTMPLWREADELTRILVPSRETESKSTIQKSQIDRKSIITNQQRINNQESQIDN